MRAVVLGIGLVLLVVSAYAVGAGWPAPFFAMPFFIGLIATLGVILERRGHKAILNEMPAGTWQDTGERFVDPETQRIVSVYFNPNTGQRVYVAAN